MDRLVAQRAVALERIARQEGWQIMRFDRLGRRLKIAGVLGAMAAVGSGGGYVAGRLRPQRRLRFRR